MKLGTSLVIQWLRHCTPNAGGPSLVHGQGTRSHMTQLRVCMLQLKSPNATMKSEDPMCHKKTLEGTMKIKVLSVVTKTWRGQINFFFKL